MNKRLTVRATIAVIAISVGAAVLGCVIFVKSADRDLFVAPSVQSQGSAAEAPVSAGWPNLFGPTHDSVSHEADVRTQWPTEGPPVKWRREIGTGYSAPICLHDRLIVFQRLGDEEVVECCDAETGELRWRHAWPTGFKSPAIYADDPHSYSNGPYSTPVIDDSRIYAWGAEGRLQCLDAVTGDEVWHRLLNEEYQVKHEGVLFPVPGSPLLEGGRLILNVGGKDLGAGIAAVSAETGETLWTATEDGPGYATPVAATIHGQRYVFVFTADGLVSLDPADGRVFWSIPFRARNRDVINASSPIVHGDIVFVSGYQLGNLCVRVLPDGSPQELWRDKRRDLDSQYNNLLCLDGNVYGFSALDRSFRCLELSTGKVRWKWDSDIGRGASLVAGGRILLLGEHGHLASLEIDPRQARPICITSESLLDGQDCFTSPALHQGLLYVRANKTLLCLDLRK